MGSKKYYGKSSEDIISDEVTSIWDKAESDTRNRIASDSENDLYTSAAEYGEVVLPMIGKNLWKL